MLETSDAAERPADAPASDFTLDAGFLPSILEVVCRNTGMGFAAVARVTAHEWVAAMVKDDIDFGLSAGDELDIDTTICKEVRASRDPVFIENVAQSPHWSAHPTPARYGFQSYISMPIFRPGGAFYGTLCAIDVHPRAIDRPEIVNMFRLFADLIGHHLDAQERLATSEANLATSEANLASSEANLATSEANLATSQASLTDERATSELREQFIAVLGHDLRSPLSALTSGISILARQPQSEKSGQILTLMRQSSSRMSGLIDNVLDFARGRLGGGISLDRQPVDMTALLAELVEEHRSSHPDRQIRLDCPRDLYLNCDPRRLSQLVSNLLGNALTHGSSAEPVRVVCQQNDGFTLSVANGGAAISDGARARLFQPFKRGGQGNSSGDGLGLGLYIASQVAIAHGGALSVKSDEQETVFTLNIPAAA